MVKFKTEIVNGTCPQCANETILVDFGNAFFRCTHCGADLEQKINGHIKYMPIYDNKARMNLKVDDWDDDGKEI